MATPTNAENLRQYKSRFSLIVEQILAFPSNTNFFRIVKNLSPNLFYVTDNSHLDKEIYYCKTLIISEVLE